MSEQPADFIQTLGTAFEAGLFAGRPGPITAAASARMTVPPTAIIAVGKAAGAMAEAARDACFSGKTGSDVLGLVVTNDENHRQIDGFTCIASAHPVPDARGLAAAAAVENLLLSLGVDDHLLLLISGGGSALLPAPALGLTLAQKIILNDALLASGLDIHAMNIVRRLFSRLKGGRLARVAAPARITQFLLSDVPDDRLESIASGPAVADPVPLDAAIELIMQHNLDRLDFVPPFLQGLKNGTVDAPVRCGDPVLRGVNSQVLASNAICRTAAEQQLRTSCPHLRVLEAPSLTGEAAVMAAQLARQILTETEAQRQTLKNTHSLGGCFGLVAGGETTVTLDMNAPGKGGRSQELALAFAAALHAAGAAAPRFWAVLAGGTDGRDGPTDAAGGIIHASQEFDQSAAMAALQSHNSYHYLQTHGQLLHRGPTGTNLADLALIIAQD